MDPEEVFGAIFGGDRFVPIIGHLGLASDMKAAMQEEDDQDDDSKAIENIKAKDLKNLSPEERAKVEEKQRIKTEKDRARQAEVSSLRFTGIACSPSDRKTSSGKNALASSSRTSPES